VGLPIVQDASNEDVRFQRNAIRHRVLPVLEEVAPGSEATLARFAMLVADDAAELERQALEGLEACRRDDELDRRMVLALPLAIRRRVLRQWLVTSLPPGLEAPFARISALEAVVGSAGATRMVQIGAGWSVAVSRERLRLEHTSGSQR
jgi:tRNA(Ile)-lysidine synthase